MSASYASDLAEDLILDLTDTRHLIREADRLAGGQHGKIIKAGNGSQRADARRHLAYLADTLARAAAEAKAQLAVVNGFTDPLKELDL